MHHVTNTYGELEISDPAFVSWVLDGTHRSSSHPEDKELSVPVR
jgi:hypothetical protein